MQTDGIDQPQVEALARHRCPIGVAKRRTQEVVVVGNRAIKERHAVRGEHDVVVLTRPDGLVHRKHVHVCEHLPEGSDLIAEEGEVPAVIARDHVHGVDATRGQAVLHGLRGLHGGERADRFLAGEGIVHDGVEAVDTGAGLPLL